MSFLYNAVQPESLRDTYTANDTIDFKINYENQMLVCNTVKVEGVLNVPDATNVALQGIQLDRNVGSHSLFDTVTTEFQNMGIVENATEYPRFVRQFTDCNYTPDDMFNANQLVELKAPSDAVAQNMLNSTNNVVDFSVKPLIALNRVSAGNRFLSYDKTGAITIRLRLATVLSALYGINVTNTTGYTISGLKLVYNTIPKMSSKEAVNMMSYVQLKQILSSGLSNINTRVPAVCRGVSCSFIDVAHLNTTQFNQLETERLPNVREVVFMFNDNTNTYITYPLRTQVEVQEHYLESLNMTGHSAMDKSKNSKYGIGLDFNQFIDLRNQKFNCQIQSDVQSGSPYQMYMYFHTAIAV